MPDDSATWQEWSRTFKEVLGLKGSPVAVAYSTQPDLRAANGRHWVCFAWRKAAEETFALLTEVI